MDINNINEVVEYINAELEKGRSMKEIEQQDFKVNERVISKRLSRRGYKKVDGVFTKDNTSNITKVESNNLRVQKPKNEGVVKVKNDIDMDKLNLLLDNLDSLLELVNIRNNINNTCNITSNETVVTSLRINKEVYQMVKQRARENNIKVMDIVNRALMDYLKNYI